MPSAPSVTPRTINVLPISFKSQGSWPLIFVEAVHNVEDCKWNEMAMLTSMVINLILTAETNARMGQNIIVRRPASPIPNPANQFNVCGSAPLHWPAHVQAGTVDMP
jgi:hypothetical protein